MGGTILPRMVTSIGAAAANAIATVGHSLCRGLDGDQVSVGVATGKSALVRTVMKILGLNAYHGDSAACLFVDGKLVAAAEEERFRRIKHWAGLPTNAINYVLGEVDHIAINRKPGVNNLRRLGFVLTHWPHPKLMAQKIKNIRRAASIKEALDATYGRDLRAQFGTGIKAEV